MDTSRDEASANAPGRPLRAGLVRTFVLLAVSLLVMAWLAEALGGVSRVFLAMREAHLFWVFVALGLLALAVFVAVVRWRIVLGAMGHRLEFRTALFAILSTMPLSVVAPSRANDLLRAHAVRSIVPPFSTVGSVLAERAIDIQSLWILSAAGALSIGRWWLAGAACLAIAAEWIVVVLVVGSGRRITARLGRHREKVERLLAAFEALRDNPRQLLASVLVSLGVWLLNVAILYVLTLAFSARVGVADVFAHWPLALFVGLLPVTLGGMGTRDAAFVYFLEASGSATMDPAAVVASTFAYAVLTTWGLALVGLPFLVSELRGAARTYRTG